jgi:hypothetical protein
MSHTAPQAGHHSHDDHKQHSSSLLLGSSLEFRDEQIYLRSIAPHVQLIRKDSAEGEVIQIQWGRVLWITTQDHILTPLIRGLVWYACSLLHKVIADVSARGIAGQYVAQIRAVFLDSKSRSEPLKQGQEGKGVSWLRKAFAGLMSGTKATPKH